MENTMLTIIGIVIGSVITTIGTVVNQLFISRKERIQLENQQAAEKFIWIRNEQKKKKNILGKFIKIH